MRSSFAKSIYVGAAVLGLAGLSAVTTTTASAKSYATAGAYTALADKSQNVTVTGTNAIYSKPGTVKGAKVVASKKTVAKLAASKKSSDTFYAYGTKTTNRGSVYYKIVTMDKKYRGYVYAGKTAGTFTAGIKAAETTTAATTPARTTGYYLKDVSKNTLWTAPKNTDINAKKVSLYGVAKNSQFTVDQAATKTKEGSLYYHVTDHDNPSISGWIYAGKGYDTTITDDAKQDLGGLVLVAPESATSDNSVNVVYVYNGNNVDKKLFVSTVSGKAGNSLNGADKTYINSESQTLNDFVNKNVPAGYVIDGNSHDTANFGGNYYIKLDKAATSKVVFKAEGSTTTDTKTIVASDLDKGVFPSLTSEQQSVFTGKDGSAVNINFAAGIFNGNNGALATLTGKTTTNTDGTHSYVEYKYDQDATKNSNSKAKYGDTLTLFYKATTKSASDKPVNPTDNGNTDYVG
jgi:hypothetical protein